MSVGKSRDGRQSPYQRGLERAAPPEEIDHRDVGKRHVGGRHADLHDRAREVTGVERLLQHLGPADGLDAHVGAVAVGERADRLDRVGLRRVDRVGRAELLRPFELPGVEIHADDRVRARELRRRDRRVAHAAATEHRDRVVARRRRRCARPRRSRPSRRSPSSPAASGLARESTLVACPAATSVFSANAPMPSAGESGVPSASVIFCCALCVEKQYHGRPRRHARHSPHTARQLRITKSPGATLVTPSPIASTTPAASWPSRYGKSLPMPPSR